MFCVHCGKEIEDGAAFCSYCGENQTVGSAEANEENQIASLFHSLFGNDNFRLATVFYIIYAVASVLSGLVSDTFAAGNIVLHIFVLIALFKLNNLARNGAPLIAFTSPLKTLRIILNVYRIILWVGVGIFAVCALLTILVGGIAGSEFGQIFEESLNEANIYLSDGAISSLGGITMFIFGILFMILAVALALVNVFMFGSYYKSVRSAEWTAGTGNYNIESLSATYSWLIVTIVFSSISALSVLTDINLASVLELISTVFNIAFTALILKLIGKLKNSGQIENL